MFKVRVIPCLDVKDGRVVKGVRFEGLRDAGWRFQSPSEIGRVYARFSGGGNLAAVRNASGDWEVLQFEQATLVGTRRPAS